jgi:hypothetical protein
MPQETLYRLSKAGMRDTVPSSTISRPVWSIAYFQPLKKQRRTATSPKRKEAPAHLKTKTKNKDRKSQQKHIHSHSTYSYQIYATACPAGPGTPCDLLTELQTGTSALLCALGLATLLFRLLSASSS